MMINIKSYTRNGLCYKIPLSDPLNKCYTVHIWIAERKDDGNTCMVHTMWQTNLFPWTVVQMYSGISLTGNWIYQPFRCFMRSKRSGTWFGKNLVKLYSKKITALQPTDLVAVKWLSPSGLYYCISNLLLCSSWHLPAPHLSSNAAPLSFTYPCSMGTMFKSCVFK